MIKFKIKNIGNYLNLDAEFKRFNLLLGDHNPTVRLAWLVHTFLKRESYWEVNNFKDEKYFFEDYFSIRWSNKEPFLLGKVHSNSSVDYSGLFADISLSWKDDGLAKINQISNKKNPLFDSIGDIDFHAYQNAFKNFKNPRELRFIKTDNLQKDFMLLKPSENVKLFFEKPFDAIMSSPNKMAIYSCQDLFFGLEVLKIVDNNPKKYKDDLGLFGVTEGVVYDLLNKTSRDTFLSQFAVTYINKN